MIEGSSISLTIFQPEFIFDENFVLLSFSPWSCNWNDFLHSIAVIMCKIYSNHFIRIWMRTNWNYHQNWIVMGNLSEAGTSAHLQAVFLLQIWEKYSDFLVSPSCGKSAIWWQTGLSQSIHYLNISNMFTVICFRYNYQTPSCVIYFLIYFPQTK